MGANQQILSSYGGAAPFSPASVPGLYQWFKADAIVAATHNITIDGNGSETIDGATTKVINTNWGSVTIKSDGTNWVTL